MMRHTNAYLRSSLVLLLIISLFSCKTTKKTIATSTQLEQSNSTVDSVATITVKTDENLTEIITETIVQTKQVVTDGLGRVYIEPIVTTSRTIERFNTIKKENVSTVALKGSTETLAISDTTSYDRETEGQEVVKDLSKGLTEGLLKGLFGNVFIYISIAVFIILLLIFVPKKVDDVSGDKR